MCHLKKAFGKKWVWVSSEPPSPALLPPPPPPLPPIPHADVKSRCPGAVARRQPSGIPASYGRETRAAGVFYSVGASCQLNTCNILCRCWSSCRRTCNRYSLIDAYLSLSQRLKSLIPSNRLCIRTTLFLPSWWWAKERDRTALGSYGRVRMREQVALLRCDIGRCAACLR